MKASLRWCFFSLVLVLALAACKAPAPVTAPAPAPSAPATPAAPPPSTSPKPAGPPADPAWAQVLDMARKEGKVTAYSFTLTGDIAKATAEAFKNRYGITLEIVGGVGAVLAERIKTESAAKRHIADTFDTAVTAILPIKDLGLLASLADLPELKQKDIWYLAPILDPADGTMVQMRVTLQAPVVNTNLVKPADEPKSFMDFLDPKWKGKKLSIAPPRVSWPLVYLHVMAPEAIDEKYLRALGGQNLFMVSTMRDEPVSVAKGEAHVAVATSLSILDPLLREGAPIKPLVMKEGTVAASPAVSVLKNAPHPNAARVFVNWWLSSEGQTVVNKALGSPSVRNDVPDFSQEKNRIKPLKLLALDEAANKLAAKYVTEGRVDKFLGVDVK